MPITDLPVDLSHPAVREYVYLVRLQMLSPLSVLVHMATILTCQFILNPSLGEISAKLYATSISPSTGLVGMYWLVLFGGEIGYCLLQLIAWKTETKNAIIHGVGLPFVFANLLVTGWAIAWAFQSFLAAAILAGAASLFLFLIKVRLLVKYPPTRSLPLSYLFIHIHTHLFIILFITLLIPHSIFLALGHRWPGTHPENYELYQWEGFAAVASSGFLASIVVAFRTDFIWGAATLWLFWAIAANRPKAAPVTGAIIFFTAFIPLVFIISLVWSRIRRHPQGTIRLAEEEAERSDRRTSLPHQERQPKNGPREHAPRAVDPADVWV